LRILGEAARSEKAVDRNGRRVFQKDFSVKGAKRRLGVGFGFLADPR
jgi:hypothetical protein